MREAGAGFRSLPILVFGLLCAACSAQTPSAPANPANSSVQRAPISPADGTPLAPQTPSQTGSAVPNRESTIPVPATSGSATSVPATTGSATSVPAPAVQSQKVVVVPAGTKVLLAMKSAVNTKSARAGDGVYLVSTFPVVVGDHVAIPPGVYVQGVIDDVQRHSRIAGKTQFHMHFTSMIFNNGNVVVIPGGVNNIPGSDDNHVNGEEGTISHNSTVGKDLGTIAGTTLPGAEVGALGGLATGRPGEGALVGGGAGLVIGTAMVLFGHNDVSLVAGTPVEMVLQRPLEVLQTKLPNPDGSGDASEYAPSPNQRQPMKKSAGAQVFCPAGLGCD